MNLRFLASRLVQALAVLLVVIAASFVLIHLTPGSPLDAERALPDDVRAMLEQRYLLDRTLIEQFLHYLGAIARFDFGRSIPLDRDVAEIIGAALPTSLLLGAQAMAFALVVGVPLGFVAATRDDGWSGRWLNVVSLTGISIPNFVLAPLLILAISAVQGGPLALDWGDWADTLLPSLCLGLFYLAYVARLARAGMAGVMHQDFIRTARAKGLAERVVRWKHGARLALQPVVSYLGPALAGVLTGSIVIEKIFNIPGLGAHFVNAAFNRDYFLVMGVVITYAGLLVVLNVFVDVAYGLLDPRVRDRQRGDP